MNIIKTTIAASIASISTLVIGTSAFAGQQVGLRYLNNLTNSQKSIYQQIANANPQNVADLQMQIRRDPAVYHDLKSRNVQIKNVIGVVKPLGGGTIYVIR